mmetsp:Transcript_21095/g.44092  ORF Transcript_21095/g.44092 Transcript_21095/m.44092 type:complete len:133 (+) Transcript_21095:965-1363(+)
MMRQPPQIHPKHPNHPKLPKHTIENAFVVKTRLPMPPWSMGKRDIFVVVWNVRVCVRPMEWDVPFVDCPLIRSFCIFIRNIKSKIDKNNNDNIQQPKRMASLGTELLLASHLVERERTTALHNDGEQQCARE